MGIFKKKKQAETKGEELGQEKMAKKIAEFEIEVKGKPTEKTYRIALGDRDNILLDEEEYVNLFTAMLERVEPAELIHFIWAAHDKKHKAAVDELKLLAMFKGMGGAVIDFIEKNGVEMHPKK